MKHAIAVLGLTFLVLTGCDKGSSSAPSTNPSRPGDKRGLTVTSPGSQTITQDGTDKMSISINRDNFEGPVDIRVDNLPKGISVMNQDLTIPADQKSVEVTLKAAADAVPVTDHEVKVSAKPKQEKDMSEAVVGFKLTVKTK